METLNWENLVAAHSSEKIQISNYKNSPKDKINILFSAKTKINENNSKISDEQLSKIKKMAAKFSTKIRVEKIVKIDGYEIVEEILDFVKKNWKNILPAENAEIDFGDFKIYREKTVKNLDSLIFKFSAEEIKFQIIKLENSIFNFDVKIFIDNEEKDFGILNEKDNLISLAVENQKITPELLAKNVAEKIVDAINRVVCKMSPENSDEIAEDIFKKILQNQSPAVQKKVAELILKKSIL